MKKLLALLAALLLMLPCAQAETWQAQLSVDYDAPAAASALTELLALFDQDELSPLIEPFAALLDGAGVRLTWQEDAVQLALLLEGQPLIDASFSVSGDRLIVTSGAVPSYALSVPVVAAEKPAAPDAAELTAIFESWLDGLPRAESTGSFAGDAYDGGTRCTAYTLDDADIASLAQQLMTDELRACLGQEAADELLGRSAAAAQENAHDYVLRLIEGADGQLIGLSFTALRGDSQLMTLSAGAGDTSARLVLGLGLKAENYWYALDASWQTVGDVTQVQGESREWSAPRDEPFAFVEAARTANAVFPWRFTAGADAAEMTVQSGSSTLTAHISKVKPLLTDLSGRTVLEKLDGETLYSIGQEAMQNLLIKLIDKLPLDMLLMLPGLMN